MQCVYVFSFIRCAVIIVKLYELMVILTLSILQYQFFPCLLMWQF